jgi:uncharacterized protein (TIRG00374 family)
MGLLIYALSYFFRALRFHFLLNRMVGVKDLFCITCVHNLVNSILPARAGELSYIYLLKKNHNRPVEEGIATLIESRVFDMIAISFLFFSSIAFAQDLPELISDAMWAIALFTAFLLVLLVSISRCNIITHAMRNAAVFLNLGKSPAFGILLEKIDNVAKIFACMNLNKFLLCVLISIACWLAAYSVVYLLLVAMGIKLPLGTALLASTFSLLTTILPIQGIGGFGTMEGGWTIGFMLFGMSKDLAIISGFGVHIITIFYFLVLGVIGSLCYHPRLTIS